MAALQGILSRAANQIIIVPSGIHSISNPQLTNTTRHNLAFDKWGLNKDQLEPQLSVPPAADYRFAEPAAPTQLNSPGFHSGSTNSPGLCSGISNSPGLCSGITASAQFTRISLRNRLSIRFYSDPRLNCTTQHRLYHFSGFHSGLTNSPGLRSGLTNFISVRPDFTPVNATTASSILPDFTPDSPTSDFALILD
ncbi:hypothetical protein DdX_20762 [Ditylenchus destructor]|uniref:Uncharacterized protein n=1 Tax=Ditylenchus destructor TaxID=166010 RepID=A0AAD4MK70_9BILA|nr:hypothetical protein DdX_20762 [Ditylenchus destructor]